MNAAPLPNSPRFSRRNLVFFVLALALMGATAWWLFRGHAPLGRDGWLLRPNAVAWPRGAWAWPLGALLLMGGLAAVSAYDRCFRAKTTSEQKMSLRLSLGALMLLSVAWNWSLLGPGGTLPGNHPGTFSLVANSWSDLSNQYLGEAYQIDDPRQWTSNYPSRQTPPSPLLAHVATHPPGATLFYYGCRRLIETSPALRSVFESLAERSIGDSPANLATEANILRATAFRSAGAPAGAPLPVEAVAVALLASTILGAAAALSIPAIFLLACSCDASMRDEKISPRDDEAAARRDARGLLACALWVLAPTVGLFAWTLDALIASLAAWTLALVLRYFEIGKQWPMIAAGALWSVTVFLSFGALALGVVVAIWAILRASNRTRWVDAARAIGWLTLGAGAMGIVLLGLFPMSPLTIFTRAMQAHHAATLDSRAYAPWLPLNFAFWALFIGWPLLVAGAISLFGRRDWARYSLPIAALTTMLLISVGGGVRGETERLWLLFVPPFCVVAADFLGSSSRLRSSLWLIFPLLQAAQTLMMAAAMAPLVRPLGQ